MTTVGSIHVDKRLKTARGFCYRKQQVIGSRHVNATKSYLHFDRFAGEAILCSNFFCFLLFLDVLFLS